MSELVFLSLGSNQGDRETFIRNAVAELRQHPAIEFENSSPIFETEPLYNREQPAFLNAVVAIRTILKPLELLDYISRLEAAAGRPALRSKNQPRSLDIDILSYSDHVHQDERLTIPHPDLHRRRFVLAPWNEIAPEHTIAGERRSVRELLQTCPDSSQVKIAEMERIA
ncbi:MAG: 2-amino-4-hydroxy-6-hydroxymethyldihydropteridine diphosphokinase [Candidatus Neomarinimicrobiota bacterium]